MSSLRAPSSPAALIGNFAEYRLVKTRGVLALIVEVPVERQAEAFAALGFPQPGTEIPVAVARLVNAPSVTEQLSSQAAYAPDVAKLPDRSAQAKAHYASLPDRQKALVRACALPKDLRFRQWINRRFGDGFGDCGIELAINYIRGNCCAGHSRAAIADDPECYERFLAMETQYKMDTGQMAEVR